MADLKTVKAGSITQNLAGRAPGVNVSTSGSPGDATTVRVRGISSFTSNDPLYIIDGVPVKDQYMNTIAPEDIESIQVLKDASTASIYGSRASNGVIVITTKKGKAGKLTVNYSGSIGVSQAVKGYDKIMNLSSTDYATAMLKKLRGDAPAFFQNPNSRSVSSFGSEANLASYFGKVDYAFNDKYLLSATVRRDGSSKFLSDVRYGIFPAFSAGWRVSQENFMQDLSWLSDLKLRASYGEVGNQDIRNYNFADIYGGSVGSTFYDIGGNNGGVATGYALVSRGNASTIWETAKTTNVGIDAAFMNNALTVVLDVYKRNTDNLLFNPALPGTAGAASAPFINVGAMENTGFDFSSTYKKQVNADFGYNLALNVSRYVNTIVKIAD